MENTIEFHMNNESVALFYIDKIMSSRFGYHIELLIENGGSLPVYHQNIDPTRPVCLTSDLKKLVGDDVMRKIEFEVNQHMFFDAKVDTEKGIIIIY